MKRFLSIKFDFLNKNLITPLYTKFMILILLIAIGIVFREFLSQTQYIGKILGLAILYFILNIVFNYGKSLINYLYRKRNKFQPSHIDNFTLGITRLSIFIYMTIFIVVCIHVLFIDVVLLATSLTIVAVAIVLIFKEYISNFMNGVSIMFSDTIKLKEFVKIGEFKGRVTNITFRHVELKSETGDVVFVPNNIVYSKEVTNYSKSNLKNIIITLTIPQQVFDNFSKFKKSLSKDLLKNYTDLIKEDKNILINICELKKDEMSVVVEIIVSKYNYKIETEVKNFVYEKTSQYLAKLKKE